ncbi:MAG: EamA family transporter [Alphaproteobacteria bacterium]|jgi:drug/metabolite transporter (DMT)-like permease|nr:EamA family transporter [Alphaproteobacteria bacterium]MBT4711581.1 EamA family transporter [Alphaproteobacteria bacterium]MBT5860460.1 EamA family transporter [Alphaproteobacteria bacterium]
MGASQWAILLLLSVLWGGSFYFIAVALTALPPLTVVTLRVGLATLALLAVMMVMGIKIPSGPVWRVYLGLGFINIAAPFSLIVWGQTHIPSGLASILNAATPLFGVVIAHIFTSDEKMTPGRAAGVVIGFSGVAIMVGPEALEGIGTNVMAQLAVLGAGICYAIGTVYARLRLKPFGINPIASAAGQVAGGTVFMLPLALVIEQPWTLAMPGMGAWGAVLGLALASTALAYIFYFKLLESTGAANILLVTFLIPVTSILLGVGLLNEVLLPKHFIGMGIIGLGLAAIDGRPYAAFRRRIW